MTNARYAPKPGLKAVTYTYDAGDDRRGRSTTAPDIAAEILRFGEPVPEDGWAKCSDGTWFPLSELDEAPGADAQTSAAPAPRTRTRRPRRRATGGE